MSISRWVVLLACLGIVVSSIGGGASAASAYSIEATQSMDTPPRTFTIDGESWTITSIGSVDAGETLSFTVQTPGDSLATVNLYTSDKQIVDSKRAPDDGTYSFETGSLSPGTYLLALSVDGSIQTIQPVVVSGYEFDVQAPDSATAGENFEVNIELTATSGTPNSVDVVVLNDTWQQELTATKIGENTYNVIVSEDLSSGTYRYYAGVRGEDTVNGEKELTGISATRTIGIEAATTTTTTTTTSSASNGGTNPTTSTTTTTTSATTTATTTQTTTTASPITTTLATTTATTQTTSAVPTTETSTSTTTQPTTETTSGSNVIQPQPETTTSVTSPGFTASTILLAMIGLLFYRT